MAPQGVLDGEWLGLSDIRRDGRQAAVIERGGDRFDVDQASAGSVDAHRSPSSAGVDGIRTNRLEHRPLDVEDGEYAVCDQNSWHDYASASS
jgi:hypothetical protein